MPRYAIVITDPEKHHAEDIARNVRANLAHHVAARKGIGPAEQAVLTARVEHAVLARSGTPKASGDLHTVAETECPDGLPNCRNCGDPAHKAACKQAGHCPNCGTRHGVAPDSYLAQSGVELVDVQGEPDGLWDVTARSFVAREPR